MKRLFGRSSKSSRQFFFFFFVAQTSCATSPTTMGTQAELTLPIVFTTQTPYVLPSQSFMIPSSWKRYQLSQLVNKALSLLKPIPFDFLVRGELLHGSLADWCTERGVGTVCVVFVVSSDLLEDKFLTRATILSSRKRRWKCSTSSQCYHLN